VSAPGRDRLPHAALGFGLAALLSSWSPLSAPFGALVGLASLLLAVRAWRRAERRRVAAAAVAVSFAAVVASAVVLALTAGVGRELRGPPVVQSPAREEVRSELDREAERTRAARERARKELDSLGTPPAGEPRREARPGTAP
jgi:hypothetical protein